MASLIHPVKIFAGSASAALTNSICEYYGALPGDMTVSRFSDGEFQPNINESVRGCDVFFIQSTYPTSDNLMELLMCIDAAKRASANYITAVIPYYGFARQDRKDKPRVSIASKLVADLLTAAGANRVMTMELHAPQIQGFFNIPVDHLEASIVFTPYIKALPQDNLVLAAPDVGSSARIREVAKALNLPMVICDKERKKANEIANMTVIGDVDGKDIVLIDDIIDTGGTLCKSSAMLIEKGAKSVRALCCHPVLSGKAYENIENSVLTELVVTDTIPLKQHSDRIKIISVAPLFARAIRNVHENGSISSLFRQIFTTQTNLDLKKS
ncbi:MAG: ribose-phosphate pyrophosphokinase [Bacteroidetes bacterium]|nr:ribose-phosphate pyrophosphokinase [Bacteroidota bacterium]MDA0943729.1 ribose-phosphate pyrophosphokinase [Bacteroidota bacterium]MDA1111410.1 ribose-phosphate pyrophosphokinase [Bacteroidota bacterium]